jgi:hypothetical protein
VLFQQAGVSCPSGGSPVLTAIDLKRYFAQGFHPADEKMQVSLRNQWTIFDLQRLKFPIAA